MIMKKIFVTMLLAFMATTINAQVTMNVRVGGGVLNFEDGDDEGKGIAGAFAFQTNIPFTKGSSYTISPSFWLLMTDDTSNLGILFPLQVGKKVRLSNRTLFFPKVGATLGYQDEAFNVGPSLALAIETGHFVVSLDAYTSLIKRNLDVYYNNNYYYNEDYSPSAASLTLGYKF